MWENQQVRASMMHAIGFWAGAEVEGDSETGL